MSGTSTDAADYSDYGAWKAWNNPFAFSAEDASLYAAETAGIPLSGARVFEIGFGEGRYLAWAESMGAIISGCELTPAALSAARERGLTLVDPDFETSDVLAPDSLDLVVAFDVFEHLDAAAIRAKLGAISRALKPGGVLILRFPNGQSPFGLDPQHADATHITPLSRAKIEQYAKRSGLVTVRYGPAAAGRAPDPARAILRGIRALLRAFIEGTIRFAYASSGELASVVTHRLIKPLGKVASAD